MKRLVGSCLIVASLFLLGASAWGADSRLEQAWKDVRSSLRQGEYHQALQTLQVILSQTPDDPWAQLYRSLCEMRLESTQPFPQLSASQLAGLRSKLQQEERSQKRSAALQKAIEREVKKEQAKWDRELDQLERDANRAQAAPSRELAQQEALRQAQTTYEEPSEPSEEPALGPTQLLPATPPGAGAPAPKGAVELAPVVVSTEPTEPSEGDSMVSPSLVGRAMPPPGAVQINAKQMSVSPERKLAIAEGDVEVVFENAVLTCDRLTLFTDTKDVYAEGRVRLEEGNQVFRGEMAHYNFYNKKGRFLQGTVFSPPWHEHGRSVAHLAEGVYEVTPGYITSCELEPPHFRFFGRRAIVFAGDELAHIRNMTFLVGRLPFLYLPWMTVADRQSPFFIIPGKKKPWGQFALMGYRYDLPIEGNHKGVARLDWRRFFGWGVGMDHKFESPQLGKGLVKVYFNEEPNQTVKDPKANLPKGAEHNRFRVLFRHRWQPMPDTTVITDMQKFSDVDFRKDFLFREEFTEDDVSESFVSVVTSDPNYTLTTQARKRVNRFQTVTEALPQASFDVREQPIGDTQLFSQSLFDVANFQTKRAHSDNDTDAVRVDWFQRLRYGFNLLRPILITPNVGVRQTYYNKDIQGGSERPQGKRDLISGQFSMGTDASLKLFRIFPITTNALGLNINWLRHVLTPTVSYAYTHEPTVPNSLLNFAASGGPSSAVTFGIENKLQTKRLVQGQKQPRTVDMARLLTSLPYTFQGSGNKQGGRLGDWVFDIELYPWSWVRLESDWSVPSHFIKGSRDARITKWNLDLVAVGGHAKATAQTAHDIQAPARQAFEPGPRGGIDIMPQGQWYLGLGHRYSQNDKTEDVLQFDWQVSQKWQIGTFHRFTFKEVTGGSKRLNNVREYQYSLRRDLHDWVGELVYRVDREFGEELFLTFTLKAYPELPIEFEDSYHQPKIGSQSSPFSPVLRQ